MMDVMMPVSASFAVGDLENSGQLRSAGKRTREWSQGDGSSAGKRRALASLSNRVHEIAGRQEHCPKVPQACFQEAPLPNSLFDFPPGHTQTSCRYATSSMCHLDTPGGFVSPMMLSPSSLTCPETIDVDQVEDDPQACCADYTKDIFTYLREAEVRLQPRVGYMHKQPDITPSMRSVLVDWLVEVSDEFSLQPSTLYLAVSLVDRFLSVMSVLRGKLQLVGTTAVYMAAKLEEIYPPELSDFAYITDNTYTHQQIVRMEQLMLQALDYRLLAPSSLCFLQRFLRAGEAHSERTSNLSLTISHLAQYLCELALVHSDPFLKYLPSEVAASSVCLARHTMEQMAWPLPLQQCTGYSVSDIGHCLQDMHRMFSMAPAQPQQAIRLKYCSDKFTKVATISVPETLPV